MATSRPSRVSRARYTSPMPPAPAGERISYGPSLLPVAKGIDFERLYPGCRRRIDSPATGIESRPVAVHCFCSVSAGFFAAGWRKLRSTMSLGSVDTGPSRHSQRIISGRIMPPNFCP